MPDAQAPVKRPMTGSSAAAVLLMLFAEEEAAQIISRLEPDEVRMLGEAMYGVADVAVDDVNTALDLFVARAQTRTSVGHGASDHIRGMMNKALGPDRAGTMLARITPPKQSSKLDMLKWMDAGEIAAMIENEHPQIAALVLAHLDSTIAADVLQQMPQDVQDDIVFRVATLGPVTQQAIDDLELLLARNHVSATGTTLQRGGTSEAAAIMNNIRKGDDQRIIKSLAKRDKKIAQSIEDEMFVFDDLMSLDDKNLGTLMRAIENDVLVVAIKGAEPGLRDKIFGCMSSRAAQTIQDEIQERGPMRLAEVTEAQRAILQTAKAMADAGTLMLGGKSDEYV